MRLEEIQPANAAEQRVKSDLAPVVPDTVQSLS